jgi:hypothetical protein
MPSPKAVEHLLQISSSRAAETIGFTLFSFFADNFLISEELAGVDEDDEVVEGTNRNKNCGRVILGS